MRSMRIWCERSTIRPLEICNPISVLHKNVKKSVFDVQTKIMHKIWYNWCLLFPWKLNLTQFFYWTESLRSSSCITDTDTIWLNVSAEQRECVLLKLKFAWSNTPVEIHRDTVSIASAPQFLCLRQCQLKRGTLRLCNRESADHGLVLHTTFLCCNWACIVTLCNLLLTGWRTLRILQYHLGLGVEHPSSHSITAGARHLHDPFGVTDMWSLHGLTLHRVCSVLALLSW